MGTKLNCWEAKKCERENGRAEAQGLEACPAAKEIKYDGINGGAMGGRACWAVSGTLCGGKVQGTFAQKRVSCMTCDFFMKVRDEEAENFELFK